MTGPPGKGEQVGPYRVLRRLGAGGMGVVDEAVHVETGARVALKRLTPEAAADPELRLRFAREARALAALDHPHVARVHAAELDGPAPYLVQVLLPGGSLAERLRVGALPLDEARRVFLELVAGLAHAHARGVLHRDLKPENVLFDEQGRAVLADFGLARVSGEVSLTATGVVLGTPAYMAPEQARDSKEVDGRADVYGLGALLYAMLTGCPPFHSDGRGLLALLARLQHEPPPPLRQRRPDAPADLIAVCERALEKDPARRWPDAADLREALGRQGSPARGAQTRLPLAAAGALLVCGLLALLWPRGPTAPAAPDRPATPSGPDSPPPPRTNPPAPAAPEQPPEPEPTPEPGPWKLVPLLDPAAGLPEHPPLACFHGDDVVLWVRGSLWRCPRTTGPGAKLEPVPAEGLPAGPLSFLVSAGDALWAGNDGVWRIRGGRAERALETARSPDVAVGPDRLAILDGKWVVVLPLEGKGSSLALPLPSADRAAFAPDGTLLVVGSVKRQESSTVWSIPPSASAPGEAWQAGVNVRALAFHPRGDRLVLGDTNGGLVQLSWPDRLSREPYVVADLALAALGATVRGCAFVRGGAQLLTLARTEIGEEREFQLAAWDTARRERLQLESGPTRAQESAQLLASPEGDQALFNTHVQVWLVRAARGP